MKVSMLLAAASVLALSSAAYASDLMIDPPAAVQYSTHTSGWSGAYVGAFGGYGVVNATQGDTDAVFTGDDIDLSGGFIGVTAGYNFALSDGGLVLGVAGDIAAAQIEAWDDDFDTELDINWFGSLRGVVGFDAGAFMPYLTAGVAGASARINYDGDQDTHTLWGWTAGAGVQIAANENMVVDLQYRYSDYGSETFVVDPDVEVGFTSHQISAGLNWKF